MNIRPKNESELNIMRESGRILDTVHRRTNEFVAIGTSLKEIDSFIHDLIVQHKATPSFLHYHGFPASSCLSLNDVVVHGIPNDYKLQAGDILGIDIGVQYEGYHTDAAFTKALGSISVEEQKLLAVTQEALRVGIEAAKAGNMVGDIGNAIQDYVDSQGKYGIIRDLCGHGIGQGLQETPEIVNYRNNDKTVLTNGMTIAIEPMLSLGAWQVTLDDDDWTVRTADLSAAAHFETTVIIRDNDPEILVAFPLDAKV